MTTNDNLRAAFAGESQANRKYTAFSRKAEKEGFSQVARVFRAVAEAETVHALNHLELLGEVKSTLENLKASQAGEEYEYSDMYPKFIEEAKAAKDSGAVKSFHYANSVEKIHAQLYRDAIAAVERGEDLSNAEVYICPVCGFTHIGTPPEKCPVCFEPRENFMLVE
jgi:rubrerythrin